MKNKKKDKKVVEKFNLFTSSVKEVNNEERSIVAYGSKPVKDRSDEIIATDAWDLKSFKKNPVLMLSHDYSKPPVGKVLWIKTDKDGLKFKAVFAKTAVGEELYQLYKEGVMKAFSVGFIPKKWEDKESKDSWKPELRTYTDVELLEISCVSVPCCPAALIEEVKSGTSNVKTKVLSEAIKKCGDNTQDVEEGVCTSCGEKFDVSDKEHIKLMKSVEGVTSMCPSCLKEIVESSQKTKDIDDDVFERCTVCGADIEEESGIDGTCVDCVNKKIEQDIYTECQSCGEVFDYNGEEYCEDCLEEIKYNNRVDALEEKLVILSKMISDLSEKMEVKESEAPKPSKDIVELGSLYMSTKECLAMMEKNIEAMKQAQEVFSKYIALNNTDPSGVEDEDLEIDDIEIDDIDKDVDDIDIDEDVIVQAVKDALENNKKSVYDTVDEKIKKMKGKMS